MPPKSKNTKGGKKGGKGLNDDDLLDMMIAQNESGDAPAAPSPAKKGKKAAPSAAAKKSKNDAEQETPALGVEAVPAADEQPQEPVEAAAQITDANELKCPICGGECVAPVKLRNSGYLVCSKCIAPLAAQSGGVKAKCPVTNTITTFRAWNDLEAIEYYSARVENDYHTNALGWYNLSHACSGHNVVVNSPSVMDKLKKLLQHRYDRDNSIRFFDFNNYYYMFAFAEEAAIRDPKVTEDVWYCVLNGLVLSTQEHSAMDKRREFTHVMANTEGTMEQWPVRALVERLISGASFPPPPPLPKDDEDEAPKKNAAEGEEEEDTAVKRKETYVNMSNNLKAKVWTFAARYMCTDYFDVVQDGNFKFVTTKGKKIDPTIVIENSLEAVAKSDSNADAELIIGSQMWNLYYTHITQKSNTVPAHKQYQAKSFLTMMAEKYKDHQTHETMTTMAVAHRDILDARARQSLKHPVNPMHLYGKAVAACSPYRRVQVWVMNHLKEGERLFINGKALTPAEVEESWKSEDVEGAVGTETADWDTMTDEEKGAKMAQDALRTIREKKEQAAYAATSLMETLMTPFGMAIVLLCFLMVYALF